MALGFNVDLLPTALSAANGKAGYAPQVWLGIDHVRLRVVHSGGDRTAALNQSGWDAGLLAAGNRLARVDVVAPHPDRVSSGSCRTASTLQVHDEGWLP